MGTGMPDGAAKVVKGDGRGVCDEEGFAWDEFVVGVGVGVGVGFIIIVVVITSSFVVWWVKGFSGTQQAGGGEQVRPRDVAGVGKVKEVRVGSYLEAGLAAAEGE